MIHSLPTRSRRPGRRQRRQRAPNASRHPVASRPASGSTGGTFEAQHKKQSVYLGGPVYEQLRRLAFDERRKMHDYLIEGLDSVFRNRGLPSIAELEKEGA